MSLIDVAAELEYVPEQELIQLSQNPNSRFPQYLVLSEVQRRNQMRRMYENQVNKAEQPLTTVADEKVMELAQSSAMPSVPSPMSNTMSQSPSGLLGMASGRSTSKETLKEASDELRRTSKAEKRFGDFSDAVVNAVKLGTMDRETAERFLLGNTELFLDASRNKEFTPYYGRNVPRAFKTKEGLRDIIKKSRNEMQQEQLGMTSGGLVSLQQGRSTDVAGNIARSLSPQEEEGLYGRELTPEERLRVAAYQKEVKEKQTAFGTGVRDFFTNLEDDIEMRRLESQERMEEGRERSKLPRVLRDDFNTSSVMPDDLQAQMEKQLLRDSLASTGNLGETGTSQANISEGEPPKTKAEGTNVLQQIFDTSGQLGLPRVEIPRMTEEDKQRELGIYALGIMADAFGTGKNIGEAGSKIGKGVQGLLDIKRTQRQEDIKADSATRAQSVEEITLSNTLLKTQLLADQYAKQGETNKLKAIELLKERLEGLQETAILDDSTQDDIKLLGEQIDAELRKVLGITKLPIYPGTQ